MVDSQSFGTSKRRRCWHFTLWQPSIYWLVESHDRKNKKLVFIISKRAKNSRDFKKSKNAKTAKTQKKKKERKKEREKEEMEMQAHGLPASHCGWEASTMTVRLKKKIYLRVFLFFFLYGLTNKKF